MSETFNIYCDESCHLENDEYGVMVLGAVWCPISEVREVTTRIREIKAKHGLSPKFEIKWSKLSQSKVQFYLDVLDYFFDNDDLHFRAVVVLDKSKLDHAKFDQTHDDWYYKMYFTMLKTILDPQSTHNIYLDIKDSKSAEKERRLLGFLRGHVSDFESKVVQRLQSVRSHESAIIQLVDLLVGAIGYANRRLDTNEGKVKFVERFRERSKRKLTQTTLTLEKKTNLLIWQAQEARDV